MLVQVKEERCQRDNRGAPPHTWSKGKFHFSISKIWNVAELEWSGNLSLECDCISISHCLKYNKGILSLIIWFVHQTKFIHLHSTIFLL